MKYNGPQKVYLDNYSFIIVEFTGDVSSVFSEVNDI